MGVWNRKRWIGKGGCGWVSSAASCSLTPLYVCLVQWGQGVLLWTLVSKFMHIWFSINYLPHAIVILYMYLYLFIFILQCWSVVMFSPFRVCRVVKNFWHQFNGKVTSAGVDGGLHQWVMSNDDLMWFCECVFSQCKASQILQHYWKVLNIEHISSAGIILANRCG